MRGASGELVMVYFLFWILVTQSVHFVKTYQLTTLSFMPFQK